MNEEFGVIQWKINGIKVLVKDFKSLLFWSFFVGVVFGVFSLFNLTFLEVFFFLFANNQE